MAVDTYDINRLAELTVLLSGPIDPAKMFEVILKEAMYITKSDGGTIYTLENDHLAFRHVITKSKYVEMNWLNGAGFIPPVPLRRSYVCAYSVMMRKRLNIPDVYASDEFDFSGTKKYDEMNHYKTTSMLVVPMIVMGGDALGVFQLINAGDDAGKVVPFDERAERLVIALSTIAALYIENTGLKARVKRLEANQSKDT